MRVSESNLVTRISGIKGLGISSCEIDGQCGVTVIIFDNEATCYMDVRGGWAAYQTTLSTNSKFKIDGICISGGSCFGLEACSGVAIEMKKKKKEIPGIEGAVIWSRNLLENDVYPTRELGKFAYKNLNSDYAYSGQVGAGKNARYGQGILSRSIEGYEFVCVIVNNAVGSIEDSNKLVQKSDEKKRRNTTITVLITNMELDYAERQQLTHQLHCSMAQTIRPFNTFQDGDIFYLCTAQEKKFQGESLTDFYLEVADLIEDTIKLTK